MAEETPQVENLEAVELKEQGNEAYRSGAYDKALNFFSSAIAIDEENSVLYCNRSMCHAALRDFKASVSDSKAALTYNPKYAKAYCRLVKALIELGQLKDARQHLLLAFKDCEKAEANKDFKTLEEELDVKYGSPLRPKPGDFDILEELGDGNFSKIYKAKFKTKAAKAQEAKEQHAAEEQEAKKNQAALLGNNYTAPSSSGSDFYAEREGSDAETATERVFAIKVIEVQTVERMKRRHRNIHNEILMEKRALNRLNHPNIVRLFATFKDYGSLYYQMEFNAGGELWRMLQEKDETNSNISNAVGLSLSQSRFVLAEALNGLEYMHNQGIVHRDIKPENLMFTLDGHLKFVDFGTAKDLIQTDLNGPEFVGTPEYMSPAAVASSKKGVGPEADLWALGVVLYQMLTGTTPFGAPSPYLSFLKTKRALIRHPSFANQNIRDVLECLLEKNPELRLAKCTTNTVQDDTDDTDDTEVVRNKDNKGNKDKVGPINYDALRRMPFFHEDSFLINPLEDVLLSHSDVIGSIDSSDSTKIGGVIESSINEGKGKKSAESLTGLSALRNLNDRPAVRVPTLRELCLRAVGQTAVKAAQIVAEHGGTKTGIAIDGPFAWVKKFSLTPEMCVQDENQLNTNTNMNMNKTNTYAVSKSDRLTILHYLNRRNQINAPALYRLFWSGVVDTKCHRVDPTFKEYLGFNRNTQGIWKGGATDENNGPGRANESTNRKNAAEFLFAQLQSPLFGLSGTDSEAEEEIAHLKASLTPINRLRPKFLAVMGSYTSSVYEETATANSNSNSNSTGTNGAQEQDESVYAKNLLHFRKCIARVSDSVPLLLVPGPRQMGLGPLQNGGSVSASAIKSYLDLFGDDYYGFWFNGVRVLVLNSSLFFVPLIEEKSKSGQDINDDEIYLQKHVRGYEQWLAEEIDQSKLCST